MFAEDEESSPSIPDTETHGEGQRILKNGLLTESLPSAGRHAAPAANLRRAVISPLSVASPVAVPLRCRICSAVLSLGFAREESFEVGGSRPQEAGIIAEVADAEIAPATEQAAHLLSRVTMIDAQPVRRALAADGARAALLRQQRVVVFDRDSVQEFEAMMSYPLSPFLRVFRPFAPLACVDLFLVRRVPGAIVGTSARCKDRILVIALPLCLSCAGRHELLRPWRRGDAADRPRRHPSPRRRRADR
jgi:hypothetical protein